MPRHATDFDTLLQRPVDPMYSVRRTWNALVHGTHTSVTEGMAGKPVMDIAKNRLTSAHAFVSEAIPTETPVNRMLAAKQDFVNLFSREPGAKA